MYIPVHLSPRLNVKSVVRGCNTFHGHVCLITRTKCFIAKVRKIGIPLRTQVLFWLGNKMGYALHGHVFMMLCLTIRFQSKSIVGK